MPRDPQLPPAEVEEKPESPETAAPIPEGAPAEGENGGLPEWFKKRPQEEEETSPPPAPTPEPADASKYPRLNIVAGPVSTTTNTGIAKLLEEVQLFFGDVVREILKDRLTPVGHPIVILLLNICAAMEQGRVNLLQPQRAELSPEQVAEIQRAMKAGKMQLMPKGSA